MSAMQLQQEKMVEEEEDECEEKKAKELAATFERGRAEAYIREPPARPSEKSLPLRPVGCGMCRPVPAPNGLLQVCPVMGSHGSRRREVGSWKLEPPSLLFPGHNNLLRQFLTSTS
jgi:hypothetical protein